MNWVFTPAFCKAKMLQGLLQHLYQEPGTMEGFVHVILDQHYPADEGGMHSEKIKALCKKYKCIYLDSHYDRGLHQGLNYAWQAMSVIPGDILIGCDPDDRPSPGAFQAMKKVMQADPLIAVCGLNFHVLPWKQKEHGLVMEEVKTAGERVWVHPSVEMWNVAAFNTHFIQSVGGFHQPNAYYGGLEVALFREWPKHGLKLVYLIDHTAESVPVNREDPELYDIAYGDWKIAHATKGYQKSYAEWLKEHE